MGSWSVFCLMKGSSGTSESRPRYRNNNIVLRQIKFTLAVVLVCLLYVDAKAKSGSMRGNDTSGRRNLRLSLASIRGLNFGGRGFKALTNKGTSPRPMREKSPFAETDFELPLYRSTDDRFLPVELALFSEASASVYEDKAGPILPAQAVFSPPMSQLREDLISLMSAPINLIMKEGINMLGYEHVMLTPVFSGVEGRVDSTSAAGLFDYGTNNQEVHVDEADLVKSDGDYVFASYGSKLLVWEAESGVEKQVIDVAPITDSETFVGSLDRLSIYYGEPKIEALMLGNQTLTVVSSQYNFKSAGEYLSDAGATKVQIFDTSKLAGDGGILDLLHEETIDGFYKAGRTIDSRNNHIVTSSRFNLHSRLETFRRQNKAFEGMDDEAYLATAKTLATALLEEEVESVIAELNVKKVMRISVFQSEVDDGVQGGQDILFQDGFAQDFLRVYSFDSNVEQRGDEVLFDSSGTFVPSSFAQHTYSTENMLILTSQGWNFYEELGGTAQATFFFGFDLDGATTNPRVVGKVRGYISNRYHLDILNGHLRVATTINNMWVRRDTGGASPPLIPQPTTENQVYIMEIPDVQGETLPVEMNTVSMLGDLGFEREVIRSVRFFNNAAYVVTFERKDPFYALDLNPNYPKELGHLNVTGFTSYLLSINPPDNNLIIGVGEETDENGRSIGVQVSLFDASTRSEPRLVHRYAFELDRFVFSESVVEWDFLALRYASLNAVDPTSKDGILFVPVRIHGGEDSPIGNFDGFVVLDVNPQTGMNLRFNVSHVESTQYFGQCWSPNQLPERSLVFNGSVTTMKGHSILHTNLDTGTQEWNITLREGLASRCVPWA